VVVCLCVQDPANETYKKALDMCKKVRHLAACVQHLPRCVCRIPGHRSC
jgi:hypothetical protein